MAEKYVYFFGDGKAEGRGDQRSLLGGKGAGLAEMSSLGIPVPPGFTCTTKVCQYFESHEQQYPARLRKEVNAALREMEKIVGKNFGDANDPLLISVRSGAPVSMPGMMDTVLNLGLNDDTVLGLAKSANNERFAWDSYRRFVQMYGDVVLHVTEKYGRDSDPFEDILEERKAKRGIEADTDLDVDDLKYLVTKFKAFTKKTTGEDFPDDPQQQLWGAMSAVFLSWNNERAIAYRAINKIASTIGTAVNVQAMVFGNTGDNSGTGVAFTRDAASGEKRFYGEYLLNAQGEDVVAGTRTPRPIKELAQDMPKAFDELEAIYQKLERHYRDMQDLEFTIQDGKLWLLQTRSGKRTGFASLRIAVDMVDEGLISIEEALLRVEPFALEQVLRPVFDPAEKAAAVDAGYILARGLNAGPGAATGRAVFSAQTALSWKAQGHDVILIRNETSPEDIAGMDAAVGILTARGGMTSHAAVVARQMGKTCVAGCGELRIQADKRTLTVADSVIQEGDWISLDGSSGEIFKGTINTRPSEVAQVLVENNRELMHSPIYLAFERLLKWADERARMKVRTNADQPEQAQHAIAFGARGIGLCRTEHMFFGDEKIKHMRMMILAEDDAARNRALKRLLPLQRDDFVGIFQAMKGYPVTIRTLDPPLHEFLPHGDKEIQHLAWDMDIEFEVLKAKTEELSELNPMLGHRGCRLGNTFPAITAMQARAIIEAAVIVTRQGLEVKPEIMIPLISDVAEYELQAQIVRRTAEEVFAESGVRLPYLVGTMIEIPRAALTADRVAEKAEFFSFGTNDLTQTTYGLSRDDSSRFLGLYQELGIFAHDPFATLDQEGVGQLVRHAVLSGRRTQPGIKLGICGEHGGDPASIEFFESVGLDYVSCSPYRVPIARLVAAQVILKQQAEEKAKPAKSKKAKMARKNTSPKR